MSDYSFLAPFSSSSFTTALCPFHVATSAASGHTSYPWSPGQRHSLVAASLRPHLRQRFIYPHLYRRLPFIVAATISEILVVFLYIGVNIGCITVDVASRADVSTRAATMSAINLIPLLCGPRTSWSFWATQVVWQDCSWPGTRAHGTFSYRQYAIPMDRSKYFRCCGASRIHILTYKTDTGLREAHLLACLSSCPGSRNSIVLLLN
jgi:hypothetical protein